MTLETLFYIFFGNWERGKTSEVMVCAAYFAPPLRSIVGIIKRFRLCLAIAK